MSGKVYIHGLEKPIAIAATTYGGLMDMCKEIGQCGVLSVEKNTFYPPHRVWVIEIRMSE